MPDISPKTRPLGRDPRWALGVIALVFLVFSAIYIHPIYQALGAQTVLAIYDLAVILSALAGAGLAIALWRHFSPKEISRTIWGNLAAGLMLWTLGEVLWSLDQLVFGNKLPYPSAADAAWLVGYIPVVTGLALRYWSFKMMPRKGWHIAILGIFGALVLLAVSFVIVPILADASAGSLFEKAVNVLYPIGDLLVALWALMLVLVLTGGVLSMPWTFIASGFLVVSASDLLYALSIWNGTYQVDPSTGLDLLSYIINITYLVSYVLVGLGLYQQARLQSAI